MKYYSKTTGGFYPEDVYGAREMQIPDPAWQRPTIEVDGQAVPDDAAVQPTITVPNPDCKIPEDAVPVSDDDYHALFAAQSEGKVIKADENGHPVAAEPEVSHNDGIKSQIAALEASVTERMRQEALCGITEAIDDRGSPFDGMTALQAIASVRQQIAALRSQLAAAA